MPQPTPSRDQVIGIIEQEARRSGIPHERDTAIVADV